MQDFDPMGDPKMPLFKDPNDHNEFFGSAEAETFRVMLSEDSRSAQRREPDHVWVLGKRAERMITAYLDCYQDDLGRDAELNALTLLGTWVLTRLAEVHSTSRTRRVPVEPEVSNTPCVVTFTIARKNRHYDYVAIRIGDGASAGKWAVTGTGTHLTWSELCAWITDENPAGRASDLRVVSGWDPV